MLPIFALLAVLAFVMREQSQAENNPKERNQLLKAVVHVNFSDPERQGHGATSSKNIEELEFQTPVG
ncbi:MAG: hypothetical protein A2V98_07935 [Planctomycetes bacterium RBG_16_64_12]|nr:MAG: hypothetical protein A2V98_07935 [Planctomycetes bacterium RBG_16_64_12]